MPVFEPGIVWVGVDEFSFYLITRKLFAFEAKWESLCDLTTTPDAAFPFTFSFLTFVRWTTPAGFFK